MNEEQVKCEFRDQVNELVGINPRLTSGKCERTMEEIEGYTIDSSKKKRKKEG